MHNYLSNNRRLLGCIFITLISFSFLTSKSLFKKQDLEINRKKEMHNGAQKIVKSHLMMRSFENEIEWAKYGKFKYKFKKGLTSL